MGRATEPRKARKLEMPTRSRTAEGNIVTPDDGVELGLANLSGSSSSARLHMPYARESGDLAGASLPMVGSRQTREGEEPKAGEYACEESRAPIEPEKSANSEVTPEESMEERGAANGNSPSETRTGHSAGLSAHTALERVGERARKQKKEQFNNLLSHIKVPLLREAYQRLNKKASAGVDGEKWAQYGETLDARLMDLQSRVHRGSYHPQPVRRVNIPKGDGRTRPLGIPTIEDKILQQAVRMVLEPIYEADFAGFSYGFRLQRSQHKALDALYVALGNKTNWVLDADIRAFFDTIDHGWMRKFIEHRIGDQRLIRLLLKWLNAGVMEDGKLHEVTAGTPQGGIISPLLSNIYLHYVLDLWVQQWRKRNARGDVYIVRYADDFVMGFQYEQDARAMHTALAERFVKYSLELHPEKTRLIRFGRFARRDSVLDGQKRPETFTFLGFTHICAEAPEGKFRVVRRTSRKKRVAKLASLKEEIERRKHSRVEEQHKWLNSVLRGHNLYYGVPGNIAALSSFRYHVRTQWHRALQRRSQRAKWTDATHRVFDARFPLLTPRITHKHPLSRLARP
jgi:RNA-directed DNA polymerase